MAVSAGSAYIAVRPSLLGFQRDLDKEVGPAGTKAASGFGSKFATGMKIAGVAGAAAVGAALTAGVVANINVGKANDKLAAQLGLGAKESGRVGKIAGGLYRDAYGDSIEEVNGAVGAVMSSIKGMAKASSKDLQSVTGKALDFATAFDTDVSRGAQVAGQLVKTGLAKNATQAFDLLTAASQKVPASLRADVLDATDEYGQFYASLGYNGKQAFSMLVEGSKDGAYGLDKMGDAVKEFTIRSTDMSDASKGAYRAIGLDAKEMSNKILAGGKSAQKGTQQVITGLLKIKDPSEQAKQAIALFGTPLEDLNVKKIPDFLESMRGTSGSMGNVAGAAKRMGDSLNDNFSTRMEGWKRSALGFVQDGLMKVVTGFESGKASGSGFFRFLSGVGAMVSTKVVPAFVKLGEWFKRDGLPAIRSFAASFSRDLQPSIDVVRRVVVEKVVPALARLAGFLWEKVLPALAKLTGFLWENRRTIAIVAAVITAVFIPAMVKAGVQAVIAKVRLVGAWVATQAAAVKSAAMVGVSFVAMAAGWVRSAAVAMKSAIRIAAAWVISLGPIGLVVAAVVGLAVVIYKNFDRIKGWISGAWEWIKTKTGAAWDWIKTKVGAAWDGIKGAVGGAVAAVRSSIAGAWDAVKTGVGNAWAAIKDRISDAWAAIKRVVGDAVGAVRDALTRAWDAVKTATVAAWSAVRDRIGAALGWVRDQIFDAVGVWKNILGSAWEWIKDKTSAAWDGIKQVLGKAWDWVQAQALAAVDRWKNNFGNAWAWIKDKTGDVWNGIKDLLGNAWGWIRTQILDAVGVWKNILSSAWEWVKDKTAGAWDWIKQTLGKAWGWIRDQFRNALDGWKNILGAAWEWIKDKTAAAWDWIKTKIAGAWDGIKDLSGRALDILKEMARRAWEQIKEWTGDLWGKIKGLIADAWDGIKGLVSDAVGWVRDRIAAGWDTIKTGTGNAWDWVKTKIGDAWDGIKNILGGVRDWIGDKVVGAFQWMTDKAGDAWAKLEGLAKTPIKFVVNTVLNKGLIAGFNKIAKVFGSDGIDPINLPFARGGVTPGYSPGRDVHRFISPTAGGLELSGGEAIMRPEWTRAIGAERVHAMNAAARRGGVEGVRRALGGEDVLHRFATGGIVNPDRRVMVDGEPLSAVHAAQLRIAARLMGTAQRVMQGSWQQATSYSGSSHTGPGVADTSPGSFAAQSAQRRAGIAAWARNIPGAAYAGSGAHIHGISLLSPGARGHSQLASWRSGGDGIGGRDYGPRPGVMPGLRAQLDVIGGLGDLKGVFGQLGKAATDAGVDAPSWARTALSGPLEWLKGLLPDLSGLGGGELGEVLRELPGNVMDMMLGKLGDFKSLIQRGVGTAISGAFNAIPQSQKVGLRSFMTMEGSRNYGWGPGDIAAWRWLVRQESSWNPKAQNPTSTAYGLGQFLDSTWATVGGRKTSDPYLQLQYMGKYMAQKYNNPSAARSFHQRNNWYDDGGMLPPGLSLAYNGTGAPEHKAVFTDAQWATMRQMADRGGGALPSRMELVLDNGQRLSGYVRQLAGHELDARSAMDARRAGAFGG